MKNINYSKQSIDNLDIQAVTKILKSPFLTKGSYTKKFENKLKKYCKVKYAVATINASCSLIIACKSLGIKKNDYVWTSNITYIASINCALHLGAKIDLVDIDSNNNICVEELEKKLKISKIKKKLPKVLIVVHLSGLPCDLEKIKKLSVVYGFKIIEDASHAFGSNYQNRKIGSCKFSDLTIFSFHPVKNITTAEGSAVTTNNKNLYNLLLLLRENGHSIEYIDKTKRPLDYQVNILGYNFRINEINSALGISQLNKIDKFTKIRRNIAKKYFKYLNIPEILLPSKDILKLSSLHLFIIKFNLKKLTINKNKIVKILKKNCIIVNCHYIPLNRFNLIKKYVGNKNYPVSNNYYKSAISLPLYPDLGHKQQLYVIKILKNIINKFKK